MTGSGESNGQWIRAALGRYEGPLLGYAARLLGDSERARDVVQETFLRLCREPAEKVRPHLAQWLYTVCRNRALDVRRKESRMTTLSETVAQARPSPEPSPPEVLDRKESAASVLDAMEQLPGDQQEVLQLKFQHGLSYRQIGKVTGHSTSNVGFLIHIGLKKIRDRLTREQPTTANERRTS